jgi:CubicO group peptidase (beta-lactamase class C family)
MEAIRHVEGWPAANVAVAVLAREGRLATRGDRARVYRWASVTKLLTAYACLVAAEEGTLDLDEPAGPRGATVRHLLSHASGLPFLEGQPEGRPGVRRIYSNVGIERAAEVLAARAQMPFDRYLHDAVLRPLSMTAQLRGSPAAGIEGSLEDLVRFAGELLQPRLVADETLEEATTVQFPGLAGVVPDLGRFDPNDWGIGFELKNGKDPHWTGHLTSSRTFGHFGGSGTFVWVDPSVGLSLACLTDLPFGDWAKAAWPALSDAVVAEAGREGTPRPDPGDSP